MDSLLNDIAYYGETMSTVDLSIVIVNWHSKDYLQKCISTILDNTLEIKYEIIVVDSASYDGSKDMLQDLYPQVRFIQSECNIGFSGANNLGVSYARGNVLLFLNPDTEVRGHAIEHLYCHHQKLHRVGVVGCRLLNSDETLQTSCVQPFPTIMNQILDAEILQRLFPRFSLWLSASTFEDVTTPIPVEVVSGACMMIGREVFDQVGKFSSDYYMYAEDIDLCYKITAAGFINYYVSEVEIVHHGGGSTQHRRNSFATVMVRESVSRLLRKTHGNSYSLCYRIALSSAAVVRLTLLALYYPVSIIRHRSSQWSIASDKWIAILRWGIGLEKWVQNYVQRNELLPNEISGKGK